MKLTEGGGEKGRGGEGEERVELGIAEGGEHFFEAEPRVSAAELQTSLFLPFFPSSDLPRSGQRSTLGN